MKYWKLVKDLFKIVYELSVIGLLVMTAYFYLTDNYSEFYPTAAILGLLWLAEIASNTSK